MTRDNARLYFFLLQQNRWLAIGIFFAAFLLYLRTLAPDVVDADGGEFQFAAWNFSLVHPTGYPLYLILGGIFQHLLPLGNPAYRLNLFTAMTAALAVAAVYLAASEITHHRSAALIATLSFAVTRTFWYDASAAETYDLNAFFIALLTYIAVRWQSEPTTNKFATFCFAYGLALTHHRTIVLWLPAFLVFFALAAWRSRLILRLRSGQANHASSFDSARHRLITHHLSTPLGRSLLRFTFYFLLPLLLYFYIPLRAPASPYATLSLASGRDLVLYDNSVTGFINYLLGRVFQSEIRWDAMSFARLVSVPQLLIDQYGVIGVMLGVVGFGVMVWRKDGIRLLLLLGGFVMTILFASSYHIGDIFHYYIPAYLVWAIWIGAGVAWIFETIRNSQYVLSTSLKAGFRIAIAVFFVGHVMIQLAGNLPYSDRSGETQPRDQWTRILSSSIPQNAILISNDRDEMMPMWYIQYVENVRRDLVGLFPIITPSPEHANVVRLTDSVLDVGRPIYFIKPMAGIEVKYKVEPADGLWRVSGRASDATPQFGSNTVLSDRVRVLGYDFVRDSNAARVVIYWQPLSKLDGNYASFVHLLDAKGNKVAQGNDHQVGGEFYPTSMWKIGETLRDEQLITLATNLLGNYRLLVGMYRQSDSEMLGEPVELGTINFP